MKLSFIGCGNMGSAIAKGLITSGFISPENICISDPCGAKAPLDGVNMTSDNVAAADFADIILLCVKPKIVPAVLAEIKGHTKTVVSIAAGVTIASIEEIIGKDKEIIRVMPNTPAMVGCGMSAICKNTSATAETLENVVKIFSAVGKTVIIDEADIHAVTAVSGSGPAYIYMVMEALADGGVLCGLKREDAYLLAAQTVLGSAQMLLETGQHPGALKDAVCSPGGTTIEAVAELEKCGMRNAFIEAVRKCKEKSEKLV